MKELTKEEIGLLEEDAIRNHSQWFGGDVLNLIFTLRKREEEIEGWQKLYEKTVKELDFQRSCVDSVVTTNEEKEKHIQKLFAELLK